MHRKEMSVFDRVTVKMRQQSIINLINRIADKAACYILRGQNGDLLIDTGYFLCRKAVEDYMKQYDVKWIITLPTVIRIF